MKIYYTEGHDAGGNWIRDEEREAVVDGFSIEDLIECLKIFVDEHPNAYIQRDTQICLYESCEDGMIGYELSMIAEGTEAPKGH